MSCASLAGPSGDPSTTGAANSSLEALSGLSIEELANVQITSVSKRPEPLSEASAAVYVITADDVRRSGATSLPEVLRLAPNLEVQQLSAVNYVISARGFGSPVASANKLLVLIDGRSIYSPLFSGVFWDAQNLVLSDIDRIEVISGPGGTLWGVNAVNGVINITTKNSRATTGITTNLDLGILNKNASVQFGALLDEHTSFRVYGMAFRHGSNETSTGANAPDAWDGTQAGARIDWVRGDDSATLQGDFSNSSVNDGEHNREQNVLARWTHKFSPTSNLEVQGYYDRVPRANNTLSDFNTVYRLDITHSFTLGDRHSIVWGGTVARVDDKFGAAVPNPPFMLTPPSANRTGENFFVQDSIKLKADLTLTLGSKFSYSGFNSFQYLPNIRLGWTVDDRNFLWAAISRSVRGASRIDKDLQSLPLIAGGPNFQPETLVAFETGYRGRPTRQSSISVSLYYNLYDDLRTAEYSPGGVLPILVANGVTGHSYGAELWGDYQVMSWWRLKAGFDWIEKDFHVKPGRLDLTNLQATGDDPKFQMSLRSQMNLSDRVEFDVDLRHIDKLPSPKVPAYTEVGLRLGWRLSESVAVALVGSNLLHDRHLEGADAGGAYEIRRSVGIQLQTHF